MMNLEYRYKSLKHIYICIFLDGETCLRIVVLVAETHTVHTVHICIFLDDETCLMILVQIDKTHKLLDDETCPII